MKHSIEHLRFPEATVGPVTELRQVTGQVLWTDAIMDTTNIALDIGIQGIEPRQDFRRIVSRTRNQPFIVAGGTIHEAISLPRL